ncbi:MAG TPA: prohibitin family protein, partial [Oligoflexia bacterium]|nr:prohibitin family protein [Oligoflexia bacterium]
EKFKSEAQAAIEEYLRKLEQAKGQVNQMVAKADGEFARARIEADAYYAQQEKRAQATRAEGEAEAKGIAEMNIALAGAGGEVMVKLRIAEALKNKKIILLPQGTGTIDLKSTNMNALLETLGLQKAAEAAK